MHTNPRGEDIDHHGAGATRQDDVSGALGGFDELLVHRFHKGLVVSQHILPGTATLGDVAADDTHQALVTVGVDKHLDVHALAQFLVDQHHDALNDDDLGGMHIDDLLRTGAGDIGIDGHGDGLAVFEAVEMVDEQVPLDGIGMVEVDLLLLLRRLSPLS